MGNQYTKEEKVEFEYYKTIIDKALTEKNSYVVFRQSRKALNKDLLDQKR